VPLCDVLMDAVVGRVASGRRTVPLRVDELHVVVDVRQESGATLHYILMSQPQFRESSPKVRIVSLGAGEGILQREDQWRSRGIGIRSCCRRQDLPADFGR